MDVFLYNFNFIWFNSALALIAVLFGWLMIKAKSNLSKLTYGFIWLIFLPNTIYILTDISHLLEEWTRVQDSISRLILILQYSLFAIVGIVTFAISIFFFQKEIDEKSLHGKKKIKFRTVIAICILNIAVGFAVVLGGIERTNSWDILTNPVRVITDTLDLLSSFEMLILSLGIGVLANVIYFLMLESLITWGRKYLRK